MLHKLVVALALTMVVYLAGACSNGSNNNNSAFTPTVTPIPPTATATPTVSVADELAAAGLGKYLDSIGPSSMEVAGGWERYHYDATPDNAICLRGTPYQVAIRRGSSNKVLLYLEGGGACWDNQTCWVAPQAKLTSDPYFGFGILDPTNADNPLLDWNVVYVPYCDGSVFSGDNTVTYDGGVTYHHGLANLSAAVSLMRQQFPNPDTILVSGSSAGGYGTFTGYGVTRVAYPDTPVLVLDDSGPGIQNTNETQAIADREQNWGYRQFVPESCTDCFPQVSYLAAWAMDRDPSLRLGLFDYLQDPVLRFFLNLDADGYESLLRDVTDDIHDRFPDRFKRYFKQGESHVILVYPDFYTMEIEGTRIRDWTADFLTDDPRWQDIIEPPNPFAGFKSARYSSDDLWLCRPGLATDQCFAHSLDATVVAPDGSTTIETLSPPMFTPDIDCFYIYPTVDLSSTPGNHTDFSDISYMLDPLLSQVARFTPVCRVFAPLYRQVTLGTFGSPNAQQYVDIAYGDVDEAFRHYMGQYNNGRRFVIMGHSQGTFMVTQLMQNYIDGDPDLRARLVAGLLIGGSVTVPDGQTVGGTFQNIPLCTGVEQNGCVIAYRSYADGYPPAGGSNVVGPEGMDTACTNPAALGGGQALFQKSYFPLFAYDPIFDIGPDTGLTTPFALYEQFYSGECTKDDHNRSYLKISVTPRPGDVRQNLVPFDAPILTPSFLGLHILDYNFPQGDLIYLVNVKAAAGL